MSHNPSLTLEQQYALSLLGEDRNVFLTGGAGCGKSFLIQHFLKDKDPKKFPVLASTGAAAVLVGGRTFHSFFGLGIMEGGVDVTVEKALRNSRVRSRLKKITGFVLDEVSMISAATLRAAETICRLVRNDERPWGGVKVIAVGDFAQLPPVERTQSRSWAFLDPTWKATDFRTIVLRENVRTHDLDFQGVLEDVRLGQATLRVQGYLEQRQRPVPDNFQGTFLFPRKEQTDALNLRRLEQIPAELKTFPTFYTGKSEIIEKLKRYSPLSDVLQLKVGSLVMLRQNDPRGRWVNGSTGILTQILPHQLTVELLGGARVQIERATFSLLNDEGESVASLSNFPVSLAYASTIHKAQGMTLDRMVVDLRSLWEPGHAYVALSRITSGEHLYVQGWSPKSIKADPAVLQFYRDASRTVASPLQSCENHVSS